MEENTLPPNNSNGKSKTSYSNTEVIKRNSIIVIVYSCQIFGAIQTNIVILLLLLLLLGRVNIVELQPLLNVDLNHIQKKIDELCRKERSMQQIEGELIAK